MSVQVNKSRIPLTDNSIIEQVRSPLHCCKDAPCMLLGVNWCRGGCFILPHLTWRSR